MIDKPKIINDPMYQLLREGKIEEFNQKKSAGIACDFKGCDFRSLDLRGLHADGINFEDSYFRNCDLRGVDLRKANLAGSSFYEAKVSGAYFPESIGPMEIQLSIRYGTRLRLRPI